jgi:hypothetical protein
MGLFDFLFKKKVEKKIEEPDNFVPHAEARSLLEIRDRMDSFISSDRYVSKKEFLPFLDEKRKTITKIHAIIVPIPANNFFIFFLLYGKILFPKIYFTILRYK